MGLFLVISVLLFCFCESIVTVQITIKQGTLRGDVSQSRNGTEYFSFYGIPFAKPPVGQLRFEPPQEADSWTGILNAMIRPPTCIQSGLLDTDFVDMFFGEEDCLYLNVFSPIPSEMKNMKAKSTYPPWPDLPDFLPSENISYDSSWSSFPVMVYIHDETFFTPNNAYGPAYFMDHPIVVVVIQYRLNVLGFLSAADEILPGNYGMKDQSAALRWVAKNIAAFGGDPKRVTIVGGSATHFHQHSPLSKGLFHQAISNSGTALSLLPITKPETAKKRAEAFGVLTGCLELNTRTLVECLKKVPVKQLVGTFQKFFVYDFTPPVPFGIVVESKNVSGAFLVENPWNQKPVNGVPWIVGINKNDGTLFSSRILSRQKVMDEWTRNFDRLIPLAFHYFDKITSEEASDITRAIKTYYFGNESISSKTGKNLQKMFTGGFFLDSLKAARRHNNKVFYYLYDHLNGGTFNEYYGQTEDEDYSAWHSDELIISLFEVDVFPVFTSGSDYNVSQRMVHYYVNFIQKGEPNGKEKIWQPFTPEYLDYLHIRTNVDVMERRLSYGEYKFWKYLVYFPLNEPNWSYRRAQQLDR